MLNKKMLLSLGAVVAFAGCNAEVSVARKVDHDFRVKANTVLSGPIARTELDFKVNGNQGTEECFVFTAAQFDIFKKLLEYVVACPKIVSENGNQENMCYDFKGELGFEAGNHLCYVKKASLFDKVMKCVKTKSVTPLLKNSVIATSDVAGAAIKSSVKINPFDVVNISTRLYPCVSTGSKVGNLPGIYLRVDGKTGKKGNLVGFSYRAEKNGDVVDCFFGKL